MNVHARRWSRWGRAALLLWTWLLLWDGGALAPRAAAQRAGGAAGKKAEEKVAEPVKRRARAYDEDEEEGISWGVIAGVAAGVLVLGGIAYLAVQQSKKQKKSKGGSTDEHVLGGYRLLNLMMTGQTSQVWEAAEPASGRHFAIKVLLPEHAQNPDHRRLLFHEAEVGMKVAHPNVIRVVKINREQKAPHFVMDFFPGGNLKLRILRKEFDFIKQHAHEILKQAATALAFINAKGWVHRDIKPENILVNASGDVRVIDFAIAQRVQSAGLFTRMFRKRGKTQGTHTYMSPEQIRNEPLDGRADIYSFGATAYEIVTGRPPFRAASLQDLLKKHLTEKPASPKMHNPDLTDEFCNLVLQMLAKDRKQRPPNFHDVLMTLRKIKIYKPEAAKKSPAK